MNKVLIKLYVPKLEAEYDIWLPINKKIYRVINLLIKLVYEFSEGCYMPSNMPMLYDKATAKPFDVNKSVKGNKIKNGSEIILI